MTFCELLSKFSSFVYVFQNLILESCIANTANRDPFVYLGDDSFFFESPFQYFYLTADGIATHFSRFHRKSEAGGKSRCVC